jgi:hypothetical protein
MLLARDRRRRDARAVASRGVQRERAPARADLQQALAGREPQTPADAVELGELWRVGRPHGRRLRHDQPLDERARVALLLQPGAQRGSPVRRAVFGEQRARLAVEAHEVGDHPLEPRRDEMDALRVQAVRRGAVVLEVADPVRDAERHVRRLRRDAEPREQPLKLRVVAVVADDEAGVDVPRAALGLHPHRVRVPPA